MITQRLTTLGMAGALALTSFFAATGPAQAWDRGAGEYAVLQPKKLSKVTGIPTDKKSWGIECTRDLCQAIMPRGSMPVKADSFIMLTSGSRGRAVQKAEYAQQFLAKTYDRIMSPLTSRNALVLLRTEELLVTKSSTAGNPTDHYTAYTFARNVEISGSCSVRPLVIDAATDAEKHQAGSECAKAVALAAKKQTEKKFAKLDKKKSKRS